MTSTRSPSADPFRDLGHQVVDLALGRPDFDHRVDQAGRANDLLDNLLRVCQLVGSRCGAGVDHLVERGLKLVEAQRTVVHGAGQPEPEVDQHLFARPIAVVHAAQLRDGHVRLVDDEQPVGREVVQQRPRPRAGRTQ